jgi:hypothetical protein
MALGRKKDQQHKMFFFFDEMPKSPSYVFYDHGPITRPRMTCLSAKEFSPVCWGGFSRGLKMASHLFGDFFEIYRTL